MTAIVNPSHFILDVFVSGRPRPQGSVKAFTNNRTGRPIIVKDNDKVQKSWRGDVRETVERYWTGPPIDGPIYVRCDFVMPRPLSTTKKHTPPAVKKPDGDKLERAVWDALTLVVWTDDSRIIDWAGSKRIAEIGETPGCRIRVAHVHVVGT
jgi:crossover junction endodeoxyribonuclease RusA